MAAIRLGRPSDAKLQAILSSQAGAAVTYPEIGATADPHLPAGYAHVYEAIELGTGDDVFRTAVDALKRWTPQVSAGARVVPAGVGIAKDRHVLVALPLGPVTGLASCRIVYVTDEADRFGFGYGTLPVHPEKGEEAFHVERHPNGSVRFLVAAFSKPADLLTKLGGPIPKLVQKTVTRRYLEGMRKATAGPT